MIGFALRQGSTMAAKVDGLAAFILWTSAISFFIIVFGKLFFIFRFHRRRVPEHQSIYLTGHTATELSVAGILTVWVMVIFWWGWTDYKEFRSAPRGAMEINIIGQQWSWSMLYPNGTKLSNELIVPKGKPVKLIMTSKDVIHSFYIPDFRIKQDVIPNTYTSLWFEAKETGEYPVYCAEYCGTAHSGMLATVKVVEPEEYEDWELGFVDEAKQKGGVRSLADTGRELYNTKGCVACHTLDGKQGIGPTFSGLYGKEELLEGGAKIGADENYIRESIMEPVTKVVKGYPPIMPTMKGQLTDEELNALIAFIKSLKGGADE